MLLTVAIDRRARLEHGDLGARRCSSAAPAPISSVAVLVAGVGERVGDDGAVLLGAVAEVPAVALDADRRARPARASNVSGLSCLDDAVVAGVGLQRLGEAWWSTVAVCVAMAVPSLDGQADGELPARV